MINNRNFKWLLQDIDSTLVLKVLYKNNDEEKEYGVFNVFDVLETPCDKLEIDNGNINDLTNLLTLGVVRFVNMVDSSDILEIPFNKLYLLYKNSFRFDEEDNVRLIPFSELDTFSIIDGTVRNDLLLFSAGVNDVSKELSLLMEIAYKYNEYGMQEKFNALKKINEINKNRVLMDEMVYKK